MSYKKHILRLQPVSELLPSQEWMHVLQKCFQLMFSVSDENYDANLKIKPFYMQQHQTLIVSNPQENFFTFTVSEIIKITAQLTVYRAWHLEGVKKPPSSTPHSWARFFISSSDHIPLWLGKSSGGDTIPLRFGGLMGHGGSNDLRYLLGDGVSFEKLSIVRSSLNMSSELILGYKISEYFPLSRGYNHEANISKSAVIKIDERCIFKLICTVRSDNNNLANGNWTEVYNVNRSLKYLSQSHDFAKI